MENRMKDEEWLLLDGGIRKAIKGRNLMRRKSKVFKAPDWRVGAHDESCRIETKSRSTHE